MGRGGGGRAKGWARVFLKPGTEVKCRVVFFILVLRKKCVVKPRVCVVYARDMKSLHNIFSSKVRAEIFRLLFAGGETELHIRELARRSGLHEATLRQDLAKLKGLDLVASRRDGNRVYFRANQEHPIYPELRGIVLKTTGLVDIVRTALEGADIAVAFVFGSVAAGTETAQSDIDLMVIGDLGLRALSARLSGISSRVGRELNPHVMTAFEYRKRLKRKDHFVTHVLSGPKLFIRGSARDFEAMAK